MVSFQCDACADVIKKPKLDQHRTRCNASFTCIDCSKTFPTPADWKGHTSCISEAEKYQKSLYKPKQNGGGRENGHMAGSGGRFRGKRDSWNMGHPRSQATGANGTPLGTPSRMSPVVASPPLAQDSKSPTAAVPAPVNGTDMTQNPKAHKKRKSEATAATQVEGMKESVSSKNPGTGDEKEGKEKKEKKEKREKKERGEKKEKGEKKGKAERKEEKAKKSEGEAEGKTTVEVQEVKQVKETKERMKEKTVDQSGDKEATSGKKERKEKKEKKEKKEQTEQIEQKEQKGKKRKREVEDKDESRPVPEASKNRDDHAGITPSTGITPDEKPKKSKKSKKNTEANIVETGVDTAPDHPVQAPTTNEASDGEEKKKKKRKSEKASGDAEVNNPPLVTDAPSPVTDKKSKKRKREAEEGNTTEHADAGVEKKKKKKKATAAAAS